MKFVKKVLIILLTLVLAFITIGTAAWFTFKRMDHANTGTAHIFQGANTQQIGEILENEGIVNDANIFYYYIKGKIYYQKYILKNFNEKDYDFKEGDYKFQKGDFDSILKLLVKGGNNPQSVTVTFPEGITVKDVAAYLEKNKIIKSDAFLKYVRNKDNYLQFEQKYPWLPAPKVGITEYFEGYLNTSTYKFPKKEKDFSVDASLIVNMMLSETDKWYKTYQADMVKEHHSFSGLITLASIIEKEASSNNDRAKIAQVFYNRLKTSMNLQSDMTAAYATGKHKVFLYNSDIAIASPYNTYYVKGLPVGPISSPSQSSFLAALHPVGDSFSDLYFYARPNGQTIFSATITQHQQIVKTYEHEWKALEASQKNGH